jgi:hypothetical protein
MRLIIAWPIVIVLSALVMAIKTPIVFVIRLRKRLKLDNAGLISLNVKISCVYAYFIVKSLDMLNL